MVYGAGNPEQDSTPYASTAVSVALGIIVFVFLKIIEASKETIIIVFPLFVVFSILSAFFFGKNHKYILPISAVVFAFTYYMIYTRELAAKQTQTINVVISESTHSQTILGILGLGVIVLSVVLFYYK